MGFEPMRELSPPNRLAGGRTRPLCDPSCLYNKYSRRNALLQGFGQLASGNAQWYIPIA